MKPRYKYKPEQYKRLKDLLTAPRQGRKAAQMTGRKIEKIRIDPLRFTRALDRDGLNNTTLAKRLGMSRSTVKRWLVQKAVPLDRVQALCRVSPAMAKLFKGVK